MRFPKYFIERLRSQLLLSEVIGRHVPVKRHGREYQALCPFHKEKTPSFTISDEKGFYHCFGCGAHGDVIRFVMETQGMSYPEAIEKLAAEAGLPLPEVTPEQERKERQRLTLYDVTERACLWFEGQLHAGVGREARDYLKERGILPETVQRFRLGYAPDATEPMVQAMREQGISEQQLRDAGLLVRRDDGSHYSRFRGRLIFPITDSRERVIAFGGRILSASKKVAKYLNSPETELFHKGEVLYHFAAARKEAVRLGTVIVAEGYMDVIAMAQAGIGHAVAPLGTAVTEAQLRLLWTMADVPVFCLDGDSAGERAMERVAELALPLLEPGKTLSFARMPAGEDPDSMLRYQGKAPFEQLIARSPRLSQMLWDSRQARTGIDTPEKKAALEHQLMQLSDLIRNETVKAHFRAFFRERLWARKKDHAPVVAQRSLLGGLTEEPEGKEALRRFEAQLLLLVLDMPELLMEPQIEEDFIRMECVDSRLDRLHGAILDGWEKQPGQEGNQLRQAVTAAEGENFLDSIEKTLLNSVMGRSRSRVPREEAQNAWHAVWDGYILAQMQRDYRMAAADLANNMNDANLMRLTELQQQMERLRRGRTFSTAAEEMEA